MTIRKYIYEVKKNHNMCYKHVTVQFVEGFYIKPPTSWGWEATIPY